MKEYTLERFVEAQTHSYSHAIAELALGRKQSHWMWYIFPQMAGLGHSPAAALFAISSLTEAIAYLKHATLGPRLVHCTELVLQISHRTLPEIFGGTDALKFCSCMTLFNQAAPDNAAFRNALENFCGGVRDPKTMALLART